MAQILNSYTTGIDAGGAISFSPTQLPDQILLTTTGAPMASSFDIDYSSTPSDGTSWTVIIQGGFDLNGNNLTVFGKLVTDSSAALGWKYTFTIANGGGIYCQKTPLDFTDSSIVDGDIIETGTLPLTKLPTTADGKIIGGNSSNQAAALTVAGVLSAISSGATMVFSYVALSITNAAISATAAIAWAKMATLTASKVVVTTAGGVITTANQLAQDLGGTNIDTSASTGFPIVAAGTWSVAAQTQTLRCDISFVTAAQGTYYVRVPFPCTVTAAKARVTSTVSGTDDGTITLKDNGGTNMTGGLITIPASSAHGTGVAVTTTANNTFTANQEIQLLVAKTTSGGLCSVDITITRTTLS
jgi:hypothetical protein